MIVVDTNIIAYFYLPTPFTIDVEQLHNAEAVWAAPPLWRSEFCNILIQHVKKELIGLDTAIAMLTKANALIGVNEFTIDPVSVLTLASQSGCTAYDCEFIALAKELDTPLITFDKQLLRNFPQIAMKPEHYTQNHH